MSAFRKLDPQFHRFLAIGILNTAFGYGCYAALLFIGLHYSMAALIATACGVLFNFKSTGRLVFRSSDNRRIFRFMASYALLYLLNVAVLSLLTAVGIDPYVGGALLLPPAAALAFLLNKRWVFKNG